MGIILVNYRNLSFKLWIADPLNKIYEHEELEHWAGMAEITVSRNKNVAIAVWILFLISIYFYYYELTSLWIF